AACAEGAAKGDAAAGVFVLEQAANIAGREGVAAAGAVHEGDSKSIGTQLLPAVYINDSSTAERNDDSGSAQAVKNFRLAQRVLFAADQLGLVIVRQEDVCVWQQ